MIPGSRILTLLLQAKVQETVYDEVVSEYEYSGENSQYQPSPIKHIVMKRCRLDQQIMETVIDTVQTVPETPGDNHEYCQSSPPVAYQVEVMEAVDTESLKQHEDQKRRKCHTHNHTTGTKKSPVYRFIRATNFRRHLNISLNQCENQNDDESCGCSSPPEAEHIELVGNKSGIIWFFGKEHPHSLRH